MKVSEIYSHLNGLEFIKVHKPNLWDEIVSVVESVDAISCRSKISKEKRTQGKLFFSPKSMNEKYLDGFKTRGWEERRTSYWVTRDPRIARRTLLLPTSEQKRDIEAAGEKAFLSYNQTDFVKERIAVEVQFGKYAFVAYDLFVKHMAFFIGDIIDVGIEILPMKSLQSNMSSGVGYYEGELYNLLREGRGVPAVPLVLIGVEA